MRGGPQLIPRPEGVLGGDPPPWAGVPEARRHVDLEGLRAVLDGREPGPPTEIVPIPHRRSSAVLIPLYAGADGEARIILTRRTAHLRTHKGEVSFPGGGRDPEDPDLWATAVREAREEIALDPSIVRPIGQLDPLATLSSGALIHPFVGVLDRPPDLHPDPHEVAAILDVAVRELLLDETYREERWPMPAELGGWRRMHFFELIGDTVWGATARILHQLLHLGTASL